MQQGIPGSPPPSHIAPGNNDLGPQAGSQSKQTWGSTEHDSRPLCSVMRAPHLWRLTVYGSNVKVLICYGTSANKRLVDIITPIRVTLPGSVDVYAETIVGELGSGGHAEVTLTPVTSGCCDSECRKLVQPGVLDDDAARFVALEASVVQVGGVTGIAVTLAALQEVSLINGSTLTSGAGFLEFEP